MRHLLAFALSVSLFAGLHPGRAVAQNPPAVVTLDKLTEYLSLGVPEAKILKLVADSPAVFVLGPAEEAALRKAGATDAVIDAIKAKAKAAPQVGDIQAFIVILDVSGSMADKDTSGVAKWGPAQKAATDLVSAVPDGRQLSLIVYGHDAKRECAAVDVVLPLSEATASNKSALKAYIEKLKPAGHTPIATSLKKAGGELAKAKGLSKVILITDGMETCKGDPNKEAAELAKIDTFRGVDVVGLGLTADESKAVGEIARAGKGKYYDAKTAKDLAEQVNAVRKDGGLDAPVAEGGDDLTAADRAAMHVFGQKMFAGRGVVLHTELTINGTVVGVFSDNDVKPIGKFLKKGLNTVRFRTFSAGKSADNNWINFTFGAAAKKPGGNQFEMTQELWHYAPIMDWNFTAGKHTHRVDPTAKDMTATATLYFGGFAADTPPGRGDYLVQVHRAALNREYNCPVAVTVNVNGTVLNSVMSRSREVAITPFLKPGKNTVTVTGRGVTNDFGTSNDLIVRVGGPATFSQDKGKLTFPTLGEVKAKAAMKWDDAKSVFVGEKDPASPEGSQVIEFELKDVPVKPGK